MELVILLHAPDGEPVAAQVRALLERAGRAPVTISSEQTKHETWEKVVVLYVLSDESLADQEMLRYAEDMVKDGFPLVPVVPKISTFHFSSIPPQLSLLRNRNAMGVAPEDTARFLESVDGNLGRESFLANREVFISYRRSDAEQQARAIEDYLWSQRCAPFLDTIQIPGGQVVQEKVMQALHRKDFVLFLDSPDARGSEWVRAEILEAFLQRIPVCTVRLDPYRLHLELLQNRPSIVWDEKNPQILDMILHLISRGIASRESLDDRVRRTLADMSRVYDIQFEKLPDKRRCYQLRRGGKMMVLEYEDTVITLEGLHRLFRFFSEPPPSQGAVFVCGDFDLLPLTREAVVWASHSAPLKVMPLAEIATEIRQSLY
jgi:hypothetical protein